MNGEKKVEKRDLIDSLDKMNKLAQHYTNIGKSEKALKCISVSANWLYNYNIMYVSEKLETLLKINAKKIKVKPWEINSKRITFFDSFSIDNRGLSLIYIRGLNALGYAIQYITYKKNTNQMTRIIKELNRKDENNIVYIERENFEDIQHIMEGIKEYKSGKFLMHITPWDTTALMISYALEDIVERFMINITDHAFGLGAKAIDYNIEFRDYGYNISNKERKIPKKKLIKLPYYPAKTEAEFQGFPFDASGKKVIFSGGSLYKTSGSSIFWDTIKYILDNYEDAIFLYAGKGSTLEMDKFIKHNHYEERFYFVTERLDLDEIMKRCYFYLSTYPICGGLMAQYAISNGKIPVTYTDGANLCDEVDSFLINTNGKKLSYYDWDTMISEIDKMMMDENYLLCKAEQWKTFLPTENEFNEQLEEALVKHCTKYNVLDLSIDVEAFEEVYFKSQENNYFNLIKPVIRTRDLSICVRFIKEFCRGSICFIKRKFGS